MIVDKRENKKVRNQTSNKLNMTFFGGIRGKVILISSVAVVTALVLGIAGISALNKTSRNNDILKEINQVNLSQNENQALDTSYCYYLDTDYLDKIVTNLGDMENDAQAAKKKAGVSWSKDISEMEDSLSQTKDNYSQILDLSKQRGFTEDAGEYQKFLAGDEELSSAFADVKDDKSWIDGGWSNIGDGAQNIQVGDSAMLKNTYNAAIPKEGKRLYFYVRVGGTGVEYKDKIYVNNIVFHKGDQELNIDLTKFTEADLSGSYGEALNGLSLVQYDGKDSVCLDGTFTAANAKWEEIALKFPMEDVEMQDFDSVTYDLYTSSAPTDFQMACAFSEKFDFAQALSDLNTEFASYCRLVVEGKDIADENDKITGMFKEITDNLDIYVSDSEQNAAIAKMVKDKQDAYQAISDMDNQIVSLKQDNTSLSSTLSDVTSDLRQRIEKNTDASKTQLGVVMTIILVIGMGLIIMIAYAVSKSMNISIGRFKDTLSQMTEGNLTVKAYDKGKDEFSAFGAHMNGFLDKLTDVMKSVQDISATVNQSGEELDQMAMQSNETSGEIGKSVEEIAHGATSQAKEIDTASNEIDEMATAFHRIVENIDDLGKTSEEMKQVSSESARYMKELSDANAKTSTAFAQVVQQTYTTNESVQKIREAAELITSIASKTNLLSLNASIEAARAGEAGKGFAVVATEIQQLAEQSSSSADIIKEIIEELTNEAERTVSIVDEVTQIVQEQQEKLVVTQEKFDVLENGIAESDQKTTTIKECTEICDNARNKVEEIIVNLASISEENAASTEQTTASMLELNEVITSLAEKAAQLKNMAEKLETDLKFFRIS